MSIRARFRPLPVGTLPDRLARDAWWLAEPTFDSAATPGCSAPPSPAPAAEPAAASRLAPLPTHPIGAFRS
ncbi:hypothetical protein KL86PLE_40141 [uncultured Pleomorphomonas sp.]|uniref:Uncharacterized protein n=1 Tax=uncultured Pleomorphomonas sp. TaxID=442121 RepID=A0A212LFI6_9HYPH|nr:hypothetical protein KL86PLE_40141 [uncultured Pleomorphomonas sp.]